MNGNEINVDDDVYVMEECCYKVVGGLPEIVLFGRNYNDKFRTETHIVKGFRPYFYIPAYERNYHHLIENFDPTVEIDALGREVRKCYTKLPADVPQVRGLFSFTDMSDFLFEKRYLIDTKIKYAYKWDEKSQTATSYDVPKILLPRVVYYDIEVLAPETVMPLPAYPKYPVVSIQVKDSYTGKRLVFTHKVPQTNDPEHIACKTEGELLRAFSTYLEEVNPDIVSGWNAISYDVPYLVKRGMEIGAMIRKFGRLGNPYAAYEEETNSWNIRIKGRSTFDMLLAFKKLMIMKGQRESYALKEVSKDYGFEYTDYGPKLQRVFDAEDWGTFLQYCKNDVDALDLIDHHADVTLFEFYETVRMICGTRLDDTQFNSKLIEMKLLHDGIKPMPAKNRIYGGKKDKFEGALVLLPTPGIHENVGTVDLAALYPTIMMAFPDETSPDIDHKVIDMLKTFVTEREKLRTIRNAGDHSSGTALQEYAYKVLANSVYGVVGSPTFRLFKRECAEFVTRTGREIGSFIHKRIEDYGMKTLYGDSITGDSEVNVRDGEFNLRRVRVDSLFTSVDYHKEGKEYCRLQDTFVDSMENMNQIIDDRVISIMRHYTEKQLYKVVLSCGNSITVTEDHSIFVFYPQKGNIATVQTKKLKGKYVIYKYSSQAIQISKVVELIKLDKTEEYVYDLSTEKTHRYFANDILVHNTDSAFFSKIETAEEGLKIQDQLNEDLKKWGDERGAKVTFSLKFEKLYKKLIFKLDSSGKGAAKKKYCGHLVWKEGEVKDELNFKGLELARSDQSQLSKECLERFLRMALIEGNEFGAVNYVRDMYKKSMKGTLNYREMSIPRAIRKINTNSPHARGIENTKNGIGYIIPDGVKPRLLYLSSYPHEICIDDEVELPAYIIKIIDWEEMTDKVITKKMKSYIESIGYSWETIVHGQASLTFS